jgi:hypothetical protein
MTGANGNNGTQALGEAIAALLNAPVQLATALAGGVTGGRSPGCEIPPPCWEPRPAGHCRLELPPGGTGTVLVDVSNCDWTRRIVHITAVGAIAAWLKFDPTTLVIDPQGTGTFRVVVRVPDTVKPGQRLSGPVLIRGCMDHFVKLDVVVADCAAGGCCRAHVNDCPDHIHHWYDHFYCYRPCRNKTTRDPKDG